LGIREALSADGTTALVSAPGANDKGAVYVYHVASAGSWVSSGTPSAKLTSAAAGRYASFGDRVVLSADGTTAFVGAPYHGDETGAVYVVHVASEDAWASTSTPTATLTVADSSYLGTQMAVSSDGTTLVLGDFDNEAAYIFHASGEDAWVSTSTPTASLSHAGESDSGFGAFVAIAADGTTALITDYGAGAGGGASVFHVASEADWVSSSAPTAILTDASGSDGDDLGESLALSGDGTTAFIGAEGVSRFRGAVDVFHVAAADAWASSSTPTAILTKAGSAPGDGLGGVVRAAYDGKTVAAAAEGFKKSRGSVDVFHVSDEGAWTSSTTPTATLTNAASVRNDQLGYNLAVSADGATLLIGAPGVRWETGAADVFHVADAGSWVSSSTPTATLTVSALERCVVPRLKGLTVAAARASLKARSCSLGRVRRVVAKGRPGRVVSQSERPGLRLRVGTKVSVKVVR
jgi:hypothetical protein